MEFLTVPQQKALNQMATVTADEHAKAKGVFPKRKFGRRDIVKMLQNRKRIQHTMGSLLKSATIIKQHDTSKTYPTQISADQFQKLDTYIRHTLQMDSWGVAKFHPHEIFQGDGIPYNHVIVMSRHMDNTTFITEELPNMNCMLEVMKVYGDTGVACLETAKFLRTMGFGAVPNHSLGGNVDYTKAGYKANLGFIGKHGMLITPHSGPCNRLSIVYTSIENLEDFLTNDQDHTWGNTFCKKCKKCVRTCPHHAIYEENKVDCHGHVECISNEKCNSGFAHYGCAICIAACPFTTIGYNNLYVRSKDIRKKDTTTK